MSFPHLCRPGRGGGTWLTVRLRAAAGCRFVADFDGLYGGDEFAYKSASHELKGLRAYMQCELADLRTPLFCLVDFAGFRVIATSVLPLSKGSLVYGSCDAGAWVGVSVSLVMVLLCLWEHRRVMGSRAAMTR